MQQAGGPPQPLRAIRSSRCQDVLRTSSTCCGTGEKEMMGNAAYAAPHLSRA